MSPSGFVQDLSVPCGFFKGSRQSLETVEGAQAKVELNKRAGPLLYSAVVPGTCTVLSLASRIPRSAFLLVHLSTMYREKEKD